MIHTTMWAKIQIDNDLVRELAKYWIRIYIRLYATLSPSCTQIRIICWPAIIAVPKFLRTISSSSKSIHRKAHTCVWYVLVIDQEACLFTKKKLLTWFNFMISVILNSVIQDKIQIGVHATEITMNYSTIHHLNSNQCMWLQHHIWKDGFDILRWCWRGRRWHFVITSKQI